ncbi:hypothetical protein CTAYLR_001606 [Chrysophaeum taylorii]|uniref:Uncharacterized protein n=1 Tax=Chrysophaeum taylorii TaxID=2483200 RepID=A0AAD7UBU0_9STRA|nr:hypothetical protein CTAYLR_001606 [Chrysophaeum taylorii]
MFEKDALQSVAGSGWCEGVKLLLEKGCDPNARGAKGRSALHAACAGSCERDDLDAAFESCVVYIVAAGGDVNAVDDAGSSPLGVAAASGRLGCVRALLAAGARVFADGSGNTPLHVAARHQHLDCLEAMLEARTPTAALHAAARVGDFKGICEALAAGADPDGEGGSSSPLHVVCGGAADATAAIRALCDFGATLEARDEEGNTPLHAAAKAGNAASVAALLRGGADAAAVNARADTPLHLAVGQCAQLLVRYGAPLAALNKDGSPPLDKTDGREEAVLREAREKVEEEDPDADMLDDERVVESVVRVLALGRLAPPPLLRRGGGETTETAHPGPRDSEGHG